LCGVTDFTAESGGQAGWTALALNKRLRVLKRARHDMAANAHEFAEAISPDLARTKADTLVTELLPLLDACKFLEREAPRLLTPRRLGSNGRPVWLSGVHAEIYREPLGHILVIGPANFPLFLPGVQVLQALAAGNSVTWKPGVGGRAVAGLVARSLQRSGLPNGVLTVTDESVEAAQNAMALHPDKVIFTGSSSSGTHVLSELAVNATPAVVELSGSDAIFVMPSADLRQVVKAVAFGLRLNGGAVCMSPRRLMASETTLTALKPILESELAQIPAVSLDAKTADRFERMVSDARADGALVLGQIQTQAQRPLVIEQANPRMAITRSDIFAPVLSLLPAESMLHALELYAQCPYALTAAIFCGKSDERKARTLASMLKAGTVLINDIIAPTADPRVPFGGRGASGYGVTRGAEGLLEMTAVKTLLIRRGGGTRHLDATRDDDAPLFEGLIRALHGHRWGDRWAGVMQLMKSSRR
jgi:aldehyde dehydrogenase (NAD+)